MITIYAHARFVKTTRVQPEGVSRLEIVPREYVLLEGSMIPDIGMA